MPAADPKFDVNTELAARRTGMSLQRTRMSGDRTLMAVISTALTLISFGFAIFQVFHEFREQSVIAGASSMRHFGLAFVFLGVGILILGIIYHLQYMVGLRRMRKSMGEEGLIRGEGVFPVSLPLITALVLLIIGTVAIVNMIFHTGPFN